MSDTLTKHQERISKAIAEANTRLKSLKIAIVQRSDRLSLLSKNFFDVFHK